MRTIVSAIVAMSFTSLNSFAESFKLVCDGHMTDEGVSEFLAQSFPPSVQGVLIQYDGRSISIAGSQTLSGPYEVIETDAASITFGNRNSNTLGIINRYSGNIEMAKCGDDDCDNYEFVFQGDCYKQDRKF